MALSCCLPMVGSDVVPQCPVGAMLSLRRGCAPSGTGGREKQRTGCG